MHRKFTVNPSSLFHPVGRWHRVSVLRQHPQPGLEPPTISGLKNTLFFQELRAHSLR